MMDAKLRLEIEKRLDDLIEDAQELIDETEVYKTLENRKPKEVEESQIRNLLEIASSVDSVKALEVFIQYQMGRGKLPPNFGDRLIEKIKDLGEKSEEITRQRPQERKEVWLKMIRQYLGYMNRYFVYKRKEEGGG